MKTYTPEEFFGTPTESKENKASRLSKVSNVFGSIFGGRAIGEQIGSGIQRSIFRSQGVRDLEQAEMRGDVPSGTTMNTTSGPTLVELGGDILGTGVSALTAGSVGATRGALGAVNRAFGGGLLNRVLAEGAAGAVVGGGQAASEGEDIGRGALVGGATGAVLPAGIAGLGAAARGARQVAEGVLGTTTGAKAGSIRTAFRAGQTNSPEFLQALRGKTGAMDIVDEAQNALVRAKDTRARNYLQQFNAIAEADQQILPTTETIQQNLTSKLQDFGVRFTDEGLDFSRSSFRGDDASIRQIESLYELINEWGNEAGDLTGLGLDRLKRVIDNIPVANPKTGSIITSTRQQVRQTLIENVPGYEKMVNDYEKISNLVDDVNKTLSLGGQEDTALRKLTSALRDNNDFRQALVSDLSEQGGRDINAMIAGQQLSEATPRGLMSLLATAVGTGTVLSGGVAALFSPAILPIVATGSPRVVGEFMRALGIADSAIKPLTSVVKNLYDASEALIGQGIIRGSQSPE